LAATLAGNDGLHQSLAHMTRSSLQRVTQLQRLLPRGLVQDIKRVPKAIARIIECNGAKVPELDNRRGRRKSKRVVLHGDCADALAAREAKSARLDP